MNEERLNREIAEILRTTANVPLPPALEIRVVAIPSQIPARRSHRTAVRASLLMAAAVALAAALAAPRMLNTTAVGPSASPVSGSVRVLSAAELSAAIQSVRAGTLQPVDVVADVSIDSSRKPTPLARECDPLGACQVIGVLEGFDETDGVVTVEQAERVVPPATDETSLSGPIALHLSANGPIEFLGHARLAAGGKLSWSVAAALADTATAPDEQVIAVDGWLDGLGGVPCGPAPDPSIAPPPLVFQVPCREYLTPDPRYLIAPASDGIGSMVDIPQSDGIAVGTGAYGEFAVEPSFNSDESTEARKAIYLLRMVTYQSERSWMVVGRLDALPALPPQATPPTPNASSSPGALVPRIFSTQELEQALSADRASWVGKAVYVDGTITANPGCPSTGYCTLGTLQGSREAVVATAETRAMMPADSSFMTTGVLVVVIGESNLEYEGYAAWNTDGTLSFTPSELADPAMLNHAPLEVVAVTGWLDTVVCGSTIGGNCWTTKLGPDNLEPILNGPEPIVPVITAEYGAEGAFGTYLLRLLGDASGGHRWEIVGRVDGNTGFPKPKSAATPTPTPAPVATPMPVATPSLPPTATPTPTPTPTPTSSVSAGIALSGTFGFSGTAGWWLRTDSLSITSDAGRTWTDVTMPEGVVPTEIAAVATAPGRPLWLAVRKSPGYRLYKRDGGTWTSQDLDPVLTEQANWPADQVRITPAGGHLLTVVVTQDGGSTSAYNTLFVSQDDGAGFVRHSITGQAAMYWASVTFTSATSGLVIAGPDTYPHDFLYTKNGGATWAASKVTGVPAAPNYQPETPCVVGSDIVVPVSTCEADCGSGKETFLLLVSHDGGASFAPEGSSILANNNGFGAVGALGNAAWVTDTDVIHETSDGGATWTSTPISLPIVALDLTGPTSATAVVGESGCAGFKTDCWSRSYLAATTDGGRTWVPIGPSAS